MKTTSNAKKLARKRRKIKEDLLKSVQARYSNREFTVLKTSGAEKISVALERFVEPYDDYSDPLPVREMLFTIGLVAWNLALLGESSNGKSLADCLSMMPPDVRDDAEDILLELIVRKKLHFANDKRIIHDFKLVDNGEESYLTVICSPPVGWVPPESEG